MIIYCIESLNFMAPLYGKKHCMNNVVRAVLLV